MAIGVDRCFKRRDRPLTSLEQGKDAVDFNLGDPARDRGWLDKKRRTGLFTEAGRNDPKAVVSKPCAIAGLVPTAREGWVHSDRQAAGDCCGGDTF